jgi:hypothetical protein
MEPRSPRMTKSRARIELSFNSISTTSGPHVANSINAAGGPRHGVVVVQTAPCQPVHRGGAVRRVAGCQLDEAA